MSERSTRSVNTERDFRRLQAETSAWPFATLLVAACAIVSLVLYLQAASRSAEHADQVIGRATLVERLVIDRQAKLRAYLVTRDGSWLSTYAEVDGRVPPALESLQELVNDDPPVAARIEPIRAALSRWTRLAEEQVARAGTPQDPAAQLAEGETIQNDIRAQLQQLISVEKRLRADRVAETGRITRTGFAVGALLALVAGPLLALVTARRMRQSREQYRAALVEQERTARCLQASEEVLRLAKDAAKMGTWDWNVATGELNWSERCKEMFGLLPETRMSYGTFLAAIHPDDRERVDRAVKDALLNRTRYEVAMRVPLPDGAVRWVESMGEGFYDPQGQPVRMAGMAMDITARTVAEEQVRAERDFSAAILDTAASLIVVLDREGSIVRFSRACERLTGYAEAEVLGKSVFELFLPDSDLPAAFAVFRQLRMGDFPNQHRNLWRMKDGSERLIDWCNTAIPDERGRVQFIIATGLDVTEQNRIVEALRDSEENLRRYAEFVDHAPVVVRDPQSRILVWNRGMERLYGWPREEALGKSSHALFQTEFPQPLPEIMAAVMREGSWEGELLHRRRDGTRLVVASLWTLYRDASGEPTAIIEVNNDITAQKLAQEALEASDRRKEEFLGLLSHELRNPLAPIRNAVHILGRVNPASAQADRARTIIARQVDHLARLVDDLLDVKRISSGKLRLHRATLDLREPVRETVEDLRPLFVRRSVELRLELPESPVWVSGDRNRLAQVLGNLLQNAVKFTNAGGHVTVSVENAAGGGAALRVQDDGVGIAPETLETLFQPFVQADKTLHRTMGGLGLGLSLVRGIAELHGGSVSARSDGLGRGAELVVTLPTAAPGAATVPADAPPLPAASRRVLIVEDNEDAAETLREIVQMAGGHETEVVHDGTAAVDAAARIRPDVVLCDIGLPGVDGYEVARRLRASDLAPHARLVALSGYASPVDVDRALRAGFDYHVPKPADLEQVVRLVAQAPRCGEAAALALPTDLSTGHHELDSQHADILAATARLRTSSPAAVWETLRFLRQHTAAHFAYEEAVMEDLRFPDTAGHSEVHQQFLVRLESFQEMLEEEGATPESLEMLAGIVEEWVAEHVLKQDRRVADFIRAQGAAEPEEANGGHPRLRLA